MTAVPAERTPIWVCIVVAVLFTGCASRSKRIVERPSPTALEFIQRINENRDRLKDISASGIIRIRGGEFQSAAFGMTMAYLQPDFLKVVFLGPFGVNFGRIVLRRRGYELDFGEQYYEKGLLDEFQSLRFIPSEFSGSELLQLFLPLTAFDLKTDSVHLTKDETSHQFLLSESNSQWTSFFWVHADRPVFSRQLMLDARGDTVSFRELRTIRQQRGVYFPAEWVVQLGRSGLTITCEFELTKYQINRGLVPADFTFSRRNQTELDSTEVDLER
jgi:hypothetical protein